MAIVDWGHPTRSSSLSFGTVEPGTNVISTGNGDVGDDDGHGTLLAGTIAGVVTNIPAGGEAISSVRLLPVKFIDTRNPPTSGNAAKAIIRAVDDGAKIINASWDVGLNSDELREAIEHAEDQGVPGGCRCRKRRWQQHRLSNLSCQFRLEQHDYRHGK